MNGMIATDHLIHIQNAESIRRLPDVRRRPGRYHWLHRKFSFEPLDPYLKAFCDQTETKAHSFTDQRCEPFGFLLFFNDLSVHYSKANHILRTLDSSTLSSHHWWWARNSRGSTWRPIPLFHLAMETLTPRFGCVLFPSFWSCLRRPVSVLTPTRLRFDALFQW